MIDLTLDSMLVPALEGYKPVVGKKIEYTSLNKGGLSTQQVVENIAMPFVKQRSILVEVSATSSVIEYDASIMISGENVTLTLDRGVSPGIEIQVMCLKPARIRYTGISKNSEGLQNTLTDELNAFALTNYIWTGTAWFCSSAPGIGAVKEQLPGTPEPSSIYGGQWTELKLGGAFFRSEGGDAKPFTDPMTVTSVSGNAITVNALVTDIAVGDLIIADDEYRTITAINGTTITVDSEFTRSDLTVVILGQSAGLPNITGGIGYPQNGGNPTGAFTYSHKSASNTMSGNNDTLYANFSAKNGETKTDGTLKTADEPHVYGKSNRVTTDNITVKYWKRIA